MKKRLLTLVFVLFFLLDSSNALADRRGRGGEHNGERHGRSYHQNHGGFHNFFRHHNHNHYSGRHRSFYNHWSGRRHINRYSYRSEYYNNFRRKNNSCYRNNQFYHQNERNRYYHYRRNERYNKHVTNNYYGYSNDYNDDSGGYNGWDIANFFLNLPFFFIPYGYNGYNGCLPGY